MVLIKDSNTHNSKSIWKSQWMKIPKNKTIRLTIKVKTLKNNNPKKNWCPTNTKILLFKARIQKLSIPQNQNRIRKIRNKIFQIKKIPLMKKHQRKWILRIRKIKIKINAKMFLLMTKIKAKTFLRITKIKAKKFLQTIKIKTKIKAKTFLQIKKIKTK